MLLRMRKELSGSLLNEVYVTFDDDGAKCQNLCPRHSLGGCGAMKFGQCSSACEFVDTPCVIASVIPSIRALYIQQRFSRRKLL